MPVMSMALDDWLLEGEVVRFSAYDYYQKSEIVVTDRRLIFYRSGITREEIEVYNLSQIAGCKIMAVRNIGLAIAGAIIALIGGLILYGISTYSIKLPQGLEIIALIPVSMMFIGIGLFIAGLLAYQILELTIAGKTMRKILKLSRKQLIELAHALYL